VEEWKNGDKVILSMKDLMFKKRPVKKLIKRFIEIYVVKEIVSKNMVKLKLLVSMRIYPMVNVSRVMKYRELIKEQKVEEPEPIEVDGVEEWKVEKILNKNKV